MPLLSKSESSRQLIVRATDAKSGVLFVQNGMRPHLHPSDDKEGHGTALIG
jgi:hypothetical protein